jgi:D-3-phosphoglycerate dehydrogenase / 2-oxoglutarate reductase
LSELILVSLSTFAAVDKRPLSMLEESGYPFRLHETGKRITPPELIRLGSDATVIVAGVEPYDAQTLTQLPALRCISRCGVGVDAIDLPMTRDRGIVVTNTPAVPTQAVAELALAMFLALSRNLRPQANSMAARRWERLSSHLLSGRTVGLIGLGRIGRRVAELCRVFGCRVIAHDPYGDSEEAKRLGVELVGKQELLVRSDIVSLHAASGGAEKVLIGAAELRSMKPGSVLVNLARGEMVDETALVDVLEARHLAGAGLDVYGEEPYAGPLCDFDQVILTPHSATGTLETRSAMETQCVENALDFLSDSVNPERRIS